MYRSTEDAEEGPDPTNSQLRKFLSVLTFNIGQFKCNILSLPLTGLQNSLFFLVSSAGHSPSCTVLSMLQRSRALRVCVRDLELTTLHKDEMSL